MWAAAIYVRQGAIAAAEAPQLPASGNQAASLSKPYIHIWVSRIASPIRHFSVPLERASAGPRHQVLAGRGCYTYTCPIH